MNKFLKSLLLGYGIFIVLSIAVECYQPLVVNAYSYKKKYMDSHKEEIKVLVLGDSFMHISFNSNRLNDSAFNLAIEGQWIYYDYILLEQYIKEMKALDVVVFGMGYAVPFYRSFNYPELGTEHANHRKYMYYKFMNIPFDRNPLSWFGLFEGYINIASLVDDKKVVKNDHLGYKGYDRLVGQSKRWRYETNIDPDVIDNPHAIEQITEFTFYMKELARLCCENHVRFIVVTPPCHDYYNDNVRPEGVERIHGIIDEVRSVYSIEYKDYLQDKEFRADSLYYNCAHLNSIGADLFALRVKEDFGL